MTYNNWKMAFLPTVLLVSCRVIVDKDGSMVSSVLLGCLYGILIMDGAFFVSGSKARRLTIGSQISILFWNLLGAALVSLVLLLAAPGLLPHADTYLTNPLLAFFGALLCGIFEAIAHKSETTWVMILIGVILIYFRIPHILISFPAVIGMKDPGDCTLIIFVLLLGNLLGAGLWTAAHNLRS